MQHNIAMFRQNGGCGYVPKAEGWRKKAEEVLGGISSSHTLLTATVRSVEGSLLLTSIVVIVLLLLLLLLLFFVVVAVVVVVVVSTIAAVVAIFAACLWPILGEKHSFPPHGGG